VVPDWPVTALRPSGTALEPAAVLATEPAETAAGASPHTSQ
jgi:hypothetical protein